MKLCNYAIFFSTNFIIFSCSITKRCKKLTHYLNVIKEFFRNAYIDIQISIIKFLLTFGHLNRNYTVVTDTVVEFKLYITIVIIIIICFVLKFIIKIPIVHSEKRFFIILC